MTDPRIIELFRVLGLVHRSPRRQWHYRRLMMEWWQELCEELLASDRALYIEFFRELMRRAFYV
jgi:hypothetical protein